MIEVQRRKSIAVQTRRVRNCEVLTIQEVDNLDKETHPSFNDCKWATPPGVKRSRFLWQQMAGNIERPRFRPSGAATLL